MSKYNDWELLYLVYEGETIAYEIIFSKYLNLIYKRTIGFNIKEKNFDDFIQEGLMSLDVAIHTYVPYFKKTFNKYFDLILQRRFIAILRKESNFFYNVTLIDNYETIEEEHPTYNGELFDFEFNDFEKLIFKLRFIRNYKANDIASELNCNVKKIYNAIYLIKEKMKESLF